MNIDEIRAELKMKNVVTQEMKDMARILTEKEVTYEKTLAFLCAVKRDIFDDVEKVLKELK